MVAKQKYDGPDQLPRVPSGRIENGIWAFDPDHGHFCHSHTPEAGLKKMKTGAAVATHHYRFVIVIKRRI
jgi:hypothetical protein